ncbi:glycosyl transferase [Methylopila jiangsuensis]|uniref:Glycosyl transferase n=1 Tax=Methylopila jiangsuensis TaxID=586230 RepID=A0A9W6JKH3_9HYPH|nr:WecB/TagA/CpsF family glycosyltransferase [Methylopila jiangsuensis]MDR6285073.1 exopolysaccharide biosynthesis WecB/TagA/CpsF family protein [Methylopila jiangsuensis]GLK77540.1 glycosyl transferase [Methylopila jiangsuensis]
MAEPDLPPAPAPRLRFLGVDYHRLTPDEALDAVLARPADAAFAPLVTPNAAHVARIAEGGAQAEPYRNAWLCLNDSRVVELLAKTRGLDLPSVPGSDLVARLLSDPRFDRAAPLLLVGGDSALFQALAAKAGLTAADHYEAPMGLLTNRDAFEATVAAVEAHPARFTLLAVGSPQQEKLAEALRRRGVARGVGLCIGASVEFFVGRRPRAPRWMSRAGLEWLFRLSTEPRRMWRRYVIESPRILLLYLRDLRRRSDAP